MATRARKYHSINVGLEESDRRRLNDVAASKRKTQTELARDAIRFYLDHLDALDGIEQERETAKAIRHMEDRMAALIARSAIDVGTIYQVLWHRSDPQSRQKLFESARTQSIDRLHKKLKNEELVVKQALTDEVRKE